MQPNSTNRVVNTREDPGICFAAEILDAERCLLAIGWLDCGTLQDAASKTGLSRSHFASTEHAALHDYLRATKRESHPSLDGAAQFLQKVAPVDPCDIYWLIETYALEPLTDPRTERDLNRLAADVIANCRRIQEYRACLARARAILDRDPAELVAVPRRPAKMVKPVSRGFAYV